MGGEVVAWIVARQLARRSRVRDARISDLAGSLCCVLGQCASLSLRLSPSGQEYIWVTTMKAWWGAERSKFDRFYKSSVTRITQFQMDFTPGLERPSEYDAKRASQLAFLFSKLGFTGVLQ